MGEKEQQRGVVLEETHWLHLEMLDKLTPAFIQKKIGVLLDEMGHYIQSGGAYLTSEKGIIHQFQRRMLTTNPSSGALRKRILEKPS